MVQEAHALAQTACQMLRSHGLQQSTWMIGSLHSTRLSLHGSSHQSAPDVPQGPHLSPTIVCSSVMRPGPGAPQLALPQRGQQMRSKPAALTRDEEDGADDTCQVVVCASHLGHDQEGDKHGRPQHGQVLLRSTGQLRPCLSCPPRPCMLSSTAAHHWWNNPSSGARSQLDSHLLWRKETWPGQSPRGCT